MTWRAHVKMRVGQLDLDVKLEGDARPVALIGANGTGKTSMLRAIAGALRPASGEIEIGEHVFFSSQRGLNLPTEQRRIGYVPQGYGLFGHLRVIDNVAFGFSTRLRKKPRPERRRIAIDVLEELELAHLAERFPAQLSGGEQQRVALARALVIEPNMLLLDEPLAAMDAAARRWVRKLLVRRIEKLGRPCVIVTHDIRDVEALNAEVFVLGKGKVVQRGDADGLRHDPVDDFVAEFVGPAMPPLPEPVPRGR